MKFCESLSANHVETVCKHTAYKSAIIFTSFFVGIRPSISSYYFQFKIRGLQEVNSNWVELERRWRSFINWNFLCL